MWKLRRFCRVAAEYRWWYLPLFAGIIALFIRWPEQGRCSYLYFGGLRALESIREEILVADKPENHGGKFRHRLHVDGHISTRTENDDGK